MEIHYKRSTVAAFFALCLAAIACTATVFASFFYLHAYYWLVSIPVGIILMLSLVRWIRHSAGALRLSSPFAALRDDGLQIEECLISWSKIHHAEYWMAGEIYVVIDELNLGNIDLPPLSASCPKLHKKMVPSVPAQSREDDFGPDAIRLICWGLDKTPREIVDLVNATKDKARSAQKN